MPAHWQALAYGSTFANPNVRFYRGRHEPTQEDTEHGHADARPQRTPHGREYWSRELAGEMALLANPEEAFAEETEQAQHLARSVGVEVTGNALPWWVWFGLYRVN
jgi:hypothetical protein